MKERKIRRAYITHNFRENVRGNLNYKVHLTENTSTYQCQSILQRKKKVKGHLWVLQDFRLEGVLYSYPHAFLHSSPEALHTPSGMRDLC
jgi:hypothetical protein